MSTWQQSEEKEAIPNNAEHGPCGTRPEIKTLLGDPEAFLGSLPVRVIPGAVILKLLGAL